MAINKCSRIDLFETTEASDNEDTEELINELKCSSGFLNFEETFLYGFIIEDKEDI